MQKTVVVGMSGGVDSSVAAWLLKKEGFKVIGVTMELWKEEKEGGGGLAAAEDARQVAEKLSIPHKVLSFSEEFRHRVVDYFSEEYWHGRTPNPCIACNRYIKWEALLKQSRELGAEFLATGHYARVRKLTNGRYTLETAASAAKDQTYALYGLTQDQLAHTLMPLGAYSKEEVREIAEEIGLSVADKPDSQEICFIPDHDYAGFIQRYCGREAGPGNFVDSSGQILGRHQGVIRYTIGQRRGLGLSAGRRIFVKEIRPESNEVVIGEGDEVFSHTLHCSHINWMGLPDLLEPEISLRAKIRYSHKGEECLVRRLDKDLLECSFQSPVRAVTPGQAVVFYQEDTIAMGGVIL